MRVAPTFIALAVIAVTGVLPAEARMAVRRPRAMNLFAGASLLYDVNRLLCHLTSTGGICSADSSPVRGGGFWPKGTPDQYIFDSGLVIGGIVDPAAGFAWAGDTVGSFFFNPWGGGGEAGEAISGVLFSRDLSRDTWPSPNWPRRAVARDPDLYAPSLLGRNQVSEGDAWARYWEGNPDRGLGRSHPLGIVVDQRVLAWNSPSGNEDILYILFTFYNVTAAGSSGAYNNPTIPPADRADIAALGDRFQAMNEAAFGTLLIPDGGYTIKDAYVAVAMDADVAVFSRNYATAILPFDLGITYAGDFLPEAGWVFPGDIFSTPFYPAPGFIGVKYLKSPRSPSGEQVGLTMFSQTFGVGAPNEGAYLYRLVSGYLGATDPACSPFSDHAVARLRRVCYLGQTQTDARYYQATGPFELAPGQAETIVVAYIAAAPTDTVATYVGGNVQPGIPFTGDSIFADPTKVRLIDRIAGWESESDLNANQIISQDEVVSVQGSLLRKSLTAQHIFDNGFVGPFAPEAPAFFLVPGDNQVTVVWQPSPTEDPDGPGDPYFAVASNPASALYDANYRQYDVEGYRIYRGRTSAGLTLIAQFDYAGTVLTDYVGALDYGDLNGDGRAQCAPELGLIADCPTDLATGHQAPLVRDVVQVLPAPRGRTQLTTGSVLNLVADTLVVGGQRCLATGGVPTKCPALVDGGVPFAFSDRGVRNSFSYVYAVTTFDANSIRSGPTSLESPRLAKRVTPRNSGGLEDAGDLAAMRLLGADGNPLTVGAIPAIDAATGKFAGPFPPTDGFTAGLAAFLPQLLDDGRLTVTIDSVGTGMAELDVLPGSFEPTVYHLTGLGAGGPVSFVVSLDVPNFSVEQRSASAAFEATSIDGAKAARFGGDASFSLYGSVGLSTPNVWRSVSWARADVNGDPANSSYNGPRWWSGAANETTDDPNGGRCLGSPGNCGSVVPPILNRTAGQIAGVEIFNVASYATTPSSPGRIIEGIFASVTRAADFAVHWGAGGAVDSVVDLTHRVRVPFDTRIGATWGILNTAGFAGTNQALTADQNNGRITWSDMYCVAPAPAFIGDANGCGGAAQTPAVLQGTAALNPINFASSSFGGTATLAAGAATGTGFIFYLAGQYFVMQMAALPTAGTVWFARYYTGTVTGSAAGADFAFTPAVRPPAVPGLRAEVAYQGGTYDSTRVVSLDKVHTVPDPYYVTTALETTANQKVLRFVGLPSQAIIRIYSQSGVLVQVLSHSDPTDGGEATWNVRNRNNHLVASGVYFYHVETPTGQTKVGRFTVVNFAP